VKVDNPVYYEREVEKIVEVERIVEVENLDRIRELEAMVN